MIWVNGVAEDALAGTLKVSDRGLQYGDGVWETIAVRDGAIKQLVAHLQRLQQGLSTLAIEGVDVELLELEIRGLVDTDESCIIKIIITRGSGGRGFKYEASMNPTRIISKHPLPVYPENYYEEGVSLTLCNNTRLPHNPRLAGFKKLGCVEQVLARSEFQDDFQEGLVRDYDDAIIEGTMSNLFVITTNQTIVTPDLQACGVAGIARSCIIEKLQKMDVELKITKITLDDVMTAEGLFMSNSIIRLWPVKEFKGRTYIIPSLFRALERNLQQIL